MSQHSERPSQSAPIDFESYISRIDDAKTSDDAWGALSEFCKAENLEGACCRCFPSEMETDRQIFFSSTLDFPLPIARILHDLPAHEDVILKRSLRSFRPFHMSDDESFGRLAEQIDEPLPESEGKGAYALVVPVFGPLIRHGYFIFVGHKESFDALTDINLLHVLAQVSYLRLCELHFSADVKVPKLSRRESEVMSNVAKGRSNAEIAAIIGVSDRTVETYLLRIYDKLGVRDRVRASLRAFALGLVF